MCPVAAGLTNARQGERPFPLMFVNQCQDGCSVRFLKTVGYLANGACIASEGSNPNTDLFAVFLTDGGILGNFTGAMLGTPPIENINGVLINHYEFDETNLDPADPITTDVTAVDGDVYLATNIKPNRISLSS